MKHVISLGAGVQSSTMALMAANGGIDPMPDCAIFADTQSEPAAVYRHLEWLEKQLPFPVHRVTAGSLREQIIAATRGEQRMDARPPFFTLGGGMLRRQCTQDFKLIPIQRKVGELICHEPGTRWPLDVQVTQWIGISTDESGRMKPSRLPCVKHRWPLIELGMTRADCLEMCRAMEWPEPPKSACTFCPYHDDALWRDMRANDSESWGDAVAVDAAIRNGIASQRNGEQWFLHRSLVALDQVDLRTAEEAGQAVLFDDECEGMCGV